MKEIFKYFEFVIVKRVTYIIDTRIAIEKQTTKSLHSLVWNKMFSQECKKMIFRGINENVVNVAVTNLRREN